MKIRQNPCKKSVIKYEKQRYAHILIYKNFDIFPTDLWQKIPSKSIKNEENCGKGEKSSHGSSDVKGAVVTQKCTNYG